ncbi:S8 family peptidase [Tellurirhabdus rosea]|uniref:S8 family peptidase n=1 Tax=Tellurirhabdus rosea TaxID=2674997 RepID=UPI002253D598|nr:S8 family peptidase [Tellurirhabdus rosea]
MKQSFISLRYLAIPSLLTAMLTVVSCDPKIAPEESLTASQPKSGARTAKGEEIVPGELIVKFSRGLSRERAFEVVRRYNGNIKEQIVTKMMERAGDNDGYALLEFDSDVNELIDKLKQLPEFAVVEPNYVYNHFATSNDPFFTNGSLWGMYGAGTSPANQFGSHAAVAWQANKTGSSSVIVGIIDEGVFTTHEDLAANIWTNTFDPVDGVDNDGNGYIDDTNGWNFVNNNRTVYGGTSDDHGTHVAGTIGAVGGNGKGVAGVVWNVKMISLKFLGTTGGTTANAIKAIDYLTDLKTRHGLNIAASNNSWGGGGFSQALQDAIERANQAGILFVAAAGNNTQNIDATPSYPAGYPNSNIISVASITNTGGLSSFSNYGATRVDLGAPGSAIQSTIPGRRNTSSYASYSGTSMATPHVTGAVALYKSINPSASASAIKSAILGSVTATPSLAGKCVTGGRLNVSTF